MEKLGLGRRAPPSCLQPLVSQRQGQVVSVASEVIKQIAMLAVNYINDGHHCEKGVVFPKNYSAGIMVTLDLITETRQQNTTTPAPPTFLCCSYQNQQAV